MSRQTTLVSGRRLALLLTAQAATLAVMSALHLSGALDRGSLALGAGTAEGVLCLVLLLGASALARRGAAGRPAALIALGVTILGFIYGLSITTQSGTAIDIAYHATMLPILAATFGIVASRPASR
ncbi:MAG TPA: hypothetical protein VKV06_05560 [Acidimicrobiales bacterium]|nr:hypothetical protein [Acidimicrobiales bacterium]